MKAFDVAVDLRRKSPTFLHWHAEHLGADNHRTLAIREGFAHGFHALTDDCELIDLHTAAYKPEAEAGLNALDPRIAIDWPRPVSEISAPDRQHALLDDGYSGIRVT
ncbi:dTDP-4-dehydrorhamnose 3,5-epimerase family protein [Thiocapsa roseopersicina]|uniref:dTDP-4-dehydrorhamnose 3,5-epimerase family protein n=1 Tax=Thiocapsa roseopersicina TaxID=1058 RepID=UPI001FDEE3ED|nr:dTDP-4-dehydrorhamnose 3,5-epimerase [Thiocapsa roseopersicina]